MAATQPGEERAMLHRFRLLLPLLLAIVASPGQAQTRHTEADAMMLAKRAANFLQSHPHDVAFAAFDDPHGAFVEGELYVYVLDKADDQLTMLAHGANRGLIGLPQKDIVDAEGYNFNAETIRIVQGPGVGWVNYKWPNPLTQKIGFKSSYVMLVDGLIVGVGIYR